MMNVAERLYVDCDDTLVLWSYGDALGRHPSRLPVPNLRLAQFVRAWKAADPSREVVVWSLGGAEWANECRRAVIPDVPVVAAMDRYAKLPEPGDIFLDDEPFDSYRNATIDPRNLITDWFHGGAGGRAPGEFLLPPSETGVKSLLDFNAEALAAGEMTEVLPARRDRVYVTRNYQSAAWFAALQEGGELYYVAPVGPMDPDPDCKTPDVSFECRRAVVLAVFPVSEEDRLAAMRQVMADA